MNSDSSSFISFSSNDHVDTELICGFLYVTKLHNQNMQKGIDLINTVSGTTFSYIVRVRVIVFNDTLNYISVISWRSTYIWGKPGNGLKSLTGRKSLT